MKKIIGNAMAKIGAYLWKCGCEPLWTGDEEYEYTDIPLLSRVGFYMLKKGLLMEDQIVAN